MFLMEFLQGFKFEVELSNIINAIDESSIEIKELVNRVNLDNNTGLVDDCGKNSSGDAQKKLDLLTNEIMIKHLCKSCSCSLLLSEENDDIIIVDEKESGNYIVAFDPLDGSSNIDSNCGVGTIFSIKLDIDKTEMGNKRVLSDGNSILCAGYILYGASTEFVIAFKGYGVHRFNWDNSKNKYVYIGILNISDKSKQIYSINESNSINWNIDIKEYINQYHSSYTQRWIGSMVSDIHRTLLYGGMFCYPSDKNNVNGKLRILYECCPMAMIMEEAGGVGIIGNMSKERILDIMPLSIHQRTPILLGSCKEVFKYVKILDNINIKKLI